MFGALALIIALVCMGGVFLLSSSGVKYLASLFAEPTSIPTVITPSRAQTTIAVVTTNDTATPRAAASSTQVAIVVPTVQANPTMQPSWTPLPSATQMPTAIPQPSATLTPAAVVTPTQTEKSDKPTLSPSAQATGGTEPTATPASSATQTPTPSPSSVPSTPLPIGSPIQATLSISATEQLQVDVTSFPITLVSGKPTTMTLTLNGNMQLEPDPNQPLPLGVVIDPTQGDNTLSLILTMPPERRCKAHVDKTFVLDLSWQNEREKLTKPIKIRYPQASCASELEIALAFAAVKPEEQKMIGPVNAAIQIGQSQSSLVVFVVQVKPKKSE